MTILQTPRGGGKTTDCMAWLLEAPDTRTVVVMSAATARSLAHCHDLDHRHVVGVEQFIKDPRTYRGREIALDELEQVLFHLLGKLPTIVTTSAIVVVVPPYDRNVGKISVPR